LSRAILDTSVLIAREQARPLERALPNDVAVSVVSIAELEVGVLVARDAKTRARRLRTLTEIRSLAGSLPIDERTASAYAQLAATVLSAGRRPRIHDTWIAATALVNDAEVWTQDSDFSDFELAVTVVRV
jgi:predicted nucleic acid-binding protein